jgi:hypothetical protein
VIPLDQWVERALGCLGGAIQEKFVTNPIRVLRDDLNLKVQKVEHLTSRRDDGGACDGVSFLQDGVILYAPTPTSRRENFTLAHELGHWLVENLDGFYDWLADQDDPPRVLETACDRIAQRLLLPDNVVDSVVGERPVRAHHVLDLYDVTQASRPACAIALGNRLPGLGAVVIIDRMSREVAYASVKPDPEQGWPVVFPWPGQSVPAGHPLLNVGPAAAFARRISWRNSWGKQEDFYADAVGENKRVLAVFCEIDLWGSERLHIDPPREFDKRPIMDIYCCGSPRTVRGYPCPSCGQSHCPECGRCWCERVALREQACSKCFLRFLPHLLVGGVCEECRA